MFVNGLEPKRGDDDVGCIVSTFKIKYRSKLTSSIYISHPCGQTTTTITTTAAAAEKNRIYLKDTHGTPKAANTHIYIYI